MTSPKPEIPGDATAEAATETATEAAENWESRPHDFEVQKELHQKIRNDPDYDDWEYGTEPLPHEAWVARQKAQGQTPQP